MPAESIPVVRLQNSMVRRERPLIDRDQEDRDLAWQKPQMSCDLAHVPLYDIGYLP